ncbi:hypothetical protein D478_10900 [Brevibacillus agri BAB-2500]|nr:hypothetical protein D478_10900 [Brevibacillus agri BAB-2500]
MLAVITAIAIHTNRLMGHASCFIFSLLQHFYIFRVELIRTEVLAMPVWLLVTIICVGLLLIGSLVDWRAKRKKQTLLIDNNNRNSLDEGYDSRGRDDFH